MTRPISAHIAGKLPAMLLALSPLAVVSTMGAQRPARSPAASVAPAAFTMRQVRSYPFPNELSAAATGSRLVWALNEQGKRNLWVAEGPAFAPRKLTAYETDDGQELTSVQLSPDGKFAVYVRGGDHGSNWDTALPVNPAGSATPERVQVWTVPFDGGAPKSLGEGDFPSISPGSDRVAFVRDGQIWVAPLDGSSPAKILFTARGSNADIQWAPDGRRLAFTSYRGDHSFIGVFTDASSTVLWVAPGTTRDESPRWSPDGTRLVFVRRPGAGGAPEALLEVRPDPWALFTADAGTGDAKQLWKAPETLRGSVPSTEGGYNLHWAAAGRIVFLSYVDGWPHLYSLGERGGEPLLLTPGDFMAEYIRLSSDGKYLVFAANAGSTKDDEDRRHVMMVPVDRAAPRLVTPGIGLEWTPVLTGDGKFIAYIGASAQRPPLPMVMPIAGGATKTLGEDRIPADFPTAQLVTPASVSFKASDGVTVHGQLFDRGAGGAGASAAAKRPAVIFVHGGPPRQMLVGWHYSDYYSNCYAINQYLASLGFVVLALNYRLGIGYGFDFHQPPNAGPSGASEYLDVKAAGEWLRTLPQVDGARIGIYGGSYGGFLTAMALARNSDIFAAGVDIHGVHDWTSAYIADLVKRDRYEVFPDLEKSLKLAFDSSPVSSMSTWRSPVLLIHGDDDRNVHFNQTTDLVQRLAKQKVDFEQMVIPDDTHHWMVHANAVRADSAAAAYLDRKLRVASKAIP